MTLTVWPQWREWRTARAACRCAASMDSGSVAYANIFPLKLSRILTEMSDLHRLNANISTQQMHGGIWQSAVASNKPMLADFRWRSPQIWHLHKAF